MRPMYILLLSLFAVLGLTFPRVSDALRIAKFPCGCDSCDEIKVTPIEDRKMDDNNTIEDDNILNMEDADGNGNRTICARDRDEPDQSFPSVCHMLCYNDCTRYRIWIYEENDEKKYTVTAYRTNYYKLFDGPCRTEEP